MPEDPTPTSLLSSHVLGDYQSQPLAQSGRLSSITRTNVDDLAPTFFTAAPVVGWSDPRDSNPDKKVGNLLDYHYRRVALERGPAFP